jgi:hypothetical protein
MNIDPMKLADLAKIASERYLSEGKPLKEVVAALAEEHELSPMQIRRVAEFANHETNLALLKRSEDKNYTFDLADPDQIIQEVQSGTVKTASVTEMDLLSVLDIFRPSQDMTKVAEEIEGVRNDAPWNKEACERQVEMLLEDLLRETVSLKKEGEARGFQIRAEMEVCFEKIAGMAREHLQQNRGKLSDLLKFACSYDPESSEVWKALFGGLKDELMKLGSPVDARLIADDLEIPDGTLEIVNGEHTLAIQLDTLKNKISDEDRCKRKTAVLGTFGNAVIDQMEILKTPEDVDRNMAESLEYLSKKASEGFDAFTDFLLKESKLLGPTGKILLLLGGAGAVKTLGDIEKETVKGAIKGTARERDERRRLRELTR